MATPPSPTVISPLVSKSHPYIPIPYFPSSIVPAFSNGFVPAAVAFVYIAMLASPIELAPSPRIFMSPEFLAVSFLLLLLASEYIPTLFTDVAGVAPPNSVPLISAPDLFSIVTSCVKVPAL